MRSCMLPDLGFDLVLLMVTLLMAAHEPRNRCKPRISRVRDLGFRCSGYEVWGSGI